MNKILIKKIVIPVTIVIVISFTGYFVYKTKFSSQTSSTNRFITEKVTKGTMNVTVTGTGTVLSAATKDIAIPNNGTLANFSLSAGSTITKGSTIATVVDKTLASQISIDKLKLNQAQQQLSSVQQTDQAKITEAQQKLSEDSSNSKTPSSTIDSDNTNIQQAQNALTNDTNAQNINIQQAQNTLNNDLTQQSSETIVAPISGTLENVSNQNGDTVQSGKTLGTIEDLTNLNIQVPIDELDISKVKVGQSVNISFEDIKNQTFTGSVVSIPDNGTTSNNVTTYNVLVSINNPSQIKLGMNANVTVNVQSKANALMVPSDAIQTINGKKYILEATNSSKQYSGSSSYSKGNSSNSKGKLVEVQTGLTNQSDVEIVSGASAGQNVLVKLPNVSSSMSGKSGNSYSGKSGSNGSGFSGSGMGSSFSGGSSFGGGSR